MTEIQKAIGYFGIGFFTYLWISSATSFVEDLTHDFLIQKGLEPIFTLLISELSYAICLTILVYFVVKRISKDYHLITQKIVKYLIWSVLIFLIIQTIQISYPSVKYLLVSDAFYDNELKYLKLMKSNPTLFYLQAFCYYVAIAISFFVIYKELVKARQQRTENQT